MLAIDRFAWTNRWHPHHPAEKGLLAGGMLVLAIALPATTTAPIILLVMLLTTVLGAGIPASVWLRVMAVPLGFLIASLPLLVLSLDLTSGLQVVFSPQGLDIALSTLLRSLAAVSCLAFLTLTTPTADLMPLLRRFGIPQAVVELMLLTYRLLFVFLERATTGHQAQIARQGYVGVRNSLRSLGWLVSSLFQRSLERSRRLEIGLTARGFQGELRVLTPQWPLSRLRLIGTLGLLLGVATSGLALDATAQ
ncbi:MAG: cobalt ECF transporter T component CbiQ [Gammaproteobacteria bacterium]